MSAKLFSLSSPDVHDLENYYPEVKDEFCLLVEMLIGPLAEQGS